MRTSPTHYIAPTAISVIPNANNSANDLAVYIEQNTYIKVFCPRLGIGNSDGTFNEWKLTGRNRRLANSNKPYTIYARLNKNKKNDGYLVFAPKWRISNIWKDKYPYITKDGLATSTADQATGDYWYVKLGDVSMPANGQRTVDLDTGILGTDFWNTEWALNPDALPLRIDTSYKIRGRASDPGTGWDAGSPVYVRWDQVLDITAQLVEGWTGTDITRFHHWALTRNTESAEADASWNAAHDGTLDDVNPYRSTNFTLSLVHERGIGDDFNGRISAIFTFTAYEVNPDYTVGSGLPQYLPLVSMTFSVMAEPVESYDLEVSSETVTYNPQTGVYSPVIEYNEQTHQYSVNSGVTVRVRAKDADGKTFYPTDEQIDALGMYVYYQPMDGDSTTIRRLNLTNGRGTLPSAPFLAGKGVNTWLQVGTWSEDEGTDNIILANRTVTYIRFGAKGDTPVNCYRWYKEGLTPLLPIDVSSDEPAPASGDATGASNVYPTNKWSATIPNRPATGEWVLWMCSSIRHGDDTRDAWNGPVQMSGTKGDPGEDAEDREYIYKRLDAYPFTDTQYHPYPDKIDTGEVSPGGIANGTETNKQLNDWVPNGWSDTAMPAQSDAKYVYMSVRVKEPGQQWGAFSAPVLWSNWGVQGADGDGVQYVYKLFDHELTDAERTSNIPTKPASPNANGEWIDNTMTTAGWNDDVLAPTSSLPFCYCSIIKRINGAWGNYEKLGMWSKWAKDGESITKDSETYRYAVTIDTVQPTQDGSPTGDAELAKWYESKDRVLPLWTAGRYFWTKTIITWSDESVTNLYTRDRNPNDGQAGDSIVVDGATVMKYAVSINNVQRPTTWYDYDDIKSSIVPGKWLWSQATTYYRKSGSAAGSHDGGYSENYNVSYIGEDGRSIVSISEHYKASNLDGSDAQHSETTPAGTEQDPDWTTNPNTAMRSWNEANKYLWNYEKVTYSSGVTVERTTPQILAIWTKDGAAGKGIDSIQNMYVVTDSNEAPPRAHEQGGSTYNWSTSPTAPGQGEYLWNYEIITWINPAGTTYTDVQQIGYAGIDGEDGEDGADAVVYKIEFTDKTFALNPNTGKNVVSIKGVVYKTEGTTTTRVSLQASHFAMRFIKSDGTTIELSSGSDFGIQNNEFVTYYGNGNQADGKQNFIVEYKPDGTNILTHESLPLTVYGENGMEAIRGYADYLYDADDTGSMPAPSAAELDKINLKRYSGSSQNRIQICEANGSGGYVWKGYGKDDYPDGTMFVCKVDNHIYRASATGWVDEGRFKGDNAVVYKIEFTDSTFAYDPSTRIKTVDISGIVYKIDGGNTTVLANLGTGSTLKLYLLRSNGTRTEVPSSEITISNGSFSTDYDTGSAYNNEKTLLAVLEVNNNEVARANIPMSVYGSRGKRNRVFYYAQPWQNVSTKSYLVNDAQAPYFLYNDEYYVFNPDEDVDDYFTMAEMGTPSTANPEWQLMDNTFKYIITEAIFGRFAHFGSFVINGDWLFSQIGNWRGDVEFDGGTTISYYVLPYTQGDEPVSSSPFSLINEDEPEISSEAVFKELSNSGASQAEVLKSAVQMNAGQTYLMYAYTLSNVVIYLDGTHYTQYSVDGSTGWHDTFVSTDKYMRVWIGEDWGAPIKIVNESSTDTDYSFGISSKFYGDNQDGSPSDITTWNDTPVSVTTQKPYLWAKAVEKDSNGVAIGTTYIRLTGEVELEVPFHYNEDTRIFECLFQVPGSDSYDIVAKPSPTGATMSYTNLNMYKEWFSPNVMINGLNGKASLNNVFVSGTIKGSGNFSDLNSKGLTTLHGQTYLYQPIVPADVTDDDEFGPIAFDKMPKLPFYKKVIVTEKPSTGPERPMMDGKMVFKKIGDIVDPAYLKTNVSGHTWEDSYVMLFIPYATL